VPAPNWLQIGEILYLRPRDPSATEVAAASRAYVVFIGSDEVHLRVNNDQVVSIPLLNFERDWISLPEIRRNDFTIVGEDQFGFGQGNVYVSWPPEYVGTMPPRRDIAVGEDPFPPNPPEMVRVSLPMDGVTEHQVAHPTGPIIEINNVPMPFQVMTGQRVEVLRNGMLVEENGETVEFRVESVTTSLDRTRTETPTRFGVLPTSTGLTPHYFVTLRQVRAEPPSWMRPGARLASTIGDQGGIITGVSNGQVHIRDIERSDTSPIQLGGRVRAFNIQQVASWYRPLETPTPPWLSVGSHIVQRRDNQSYQVLGLDPLTGAMTLTLEGEVRPVRFAMTNLEQNWRPAGSLLEVRPHRPELTPIVPRSSGAYVPNWVAPGAFIRTLRRPRRTLWVTKLDDVQRMVRLQRVERFEPEVKISSNWEDAPYATLERDFEPLGKDGVPMAELKCPYCGEYGGRNKPVEERSQIKIRAYHCAKKHMWSFAADGSEEEGNLIPLSRFERDFDI